MILVKKQSLDEAYITQVPDGYDLLGNDMHYLIDKEGTIFMMTFPKLRELNGVDAEVDPILAGKTLSMLTDYIAFHKFMDTIYVSISSDVKPTDNQLNALYEILRKLKKLDKGLYLSFDWRWACGGGNAMGAGSKQAERSIKKVKEYLSTHEFKGLAWYAKGGIYGFEE